MARDSRGIVELWPGRNGRWYYHRVSGGNLVDPNNVASRRSARRAILSKWPGIRIVVTTERARTR